MLNRPSVPPLSARTAGLGKMLEIFAGMKRYFYIEKMNFLFTFTWLCVSIHLVKIGNYADFDQKSAQKKALILAKFVFFNYSLILTN